MPNPTNKSGIRDNHRRGVVADFLKDKIQSGSKLSVVSAYFTIYAYDALRENLDQIEHLDFLFGEPRFISSLDPDKTDKKSFKIEDEGLQLANRLEQKRVARDCAEWIRQKVDIRSIRQAQLLHGKMYHIANAGVEEAILGSSNFTVRGLGLGNGNNNIELNLEVDSNRDRRDLKIWFDELWNDPTLVEDVKAEVLQYLAQLYQNHAPEFIYYKTLYHIFENFLADQEKGGLLDHDIKIVDTDIWKALYEFQRDGVKGTINKILKHIAAIDALKILDPACGSGAFPMGVLHKLVYILGKLDPDNDRWKQTQLAKLDSAPIQMKDRVLNPAAHWSETPLYDAEVKKALTLVARLEATLLK